MSKHLVSIIVPVYNVEKYLYKCLDSILQQTFEDWECLLVDDGSVDESGVICDEYAASDSRFHVYHKNNEGVSKTRNTGLDHAKGQWITFIDSDDFISNTYLENLIRPILNNSEVDFVHGCGTYYAHGQAGPVIEKFEDEISSNTVKLFNRFKGFVCCKLFKRELIEHPINGKPLRFDYRIRYSEDMVFTLEYVLNVKTYAFSSEVGYFYNRDNNSSATHTIKWTYEDALYAFLIKYKCEMSYVKNSKITLNDIDNRIILLAISLHQILFLLGQKKIPISEKVNKLKKEVGVDKLFLLKYYQRGLVGRVVDRLFMLARLRAAFYFQPLATIENRLICYTGSLLRTR